MYPVSDKFLQALRQDHTAAARVELYRLGELLDGNIPIIQGTVTDDSQALIRRRLGLTLPASPQVLSALSALVPEKGGLWPLGNELKVYSGIRHPAVKPSTTRIQAGHLALPGTVGSYASTPDSPDLDVTDLDVRILGLSMEDWTPSAIGTIVSKWKDNGVSPNRRSWLIRLQTSGFLRLFYSLDGVALPFVDPPTAIWDTNDPDLLPGDVIDVRVTRVAATGSVQWYRRRPGASWSAWGGPLATPVGSLFNNDLPIMIGAHNEGAASPLLGRIERVEVLDGIDGTIVASPDFRTNHTAPFTDDQGNVWSLSGGATIVDESYDLTIGSSSVEEDELVPLGVFRISKPEIHDGPDGATIMLHGYDRSRAVSRAKFTEPYVIAAGTNYSTAIKDLIKSRLATLTNDDFIFMTTSYTTPQLVFTSDDDPMEKAASMAASMGAQIFFDGDGKCVLRPEPDPLFDPAVFAYESGETSTLVEIGRDLDDEQAYNGVIVVSENSELTVPLRAEAWDTSQNSPTYYDPDYPSQSVYGPVPYFVSSQYITTQAQCQDAADATLARVLGIIEQTQFNSINNPAHESSDIITVERGEIGATGVNILDSVTIGIGEGTMMTAATRKRRVT